eukprot:scaffold10472_cov93-Cyclotella_meneghiniana.AAC.1
MADLWAWVDEQRDSNREKFNRLLQLGKRTWTPQHVFNRCCVKWLVDGPQQYDPYGDDYFDEYNPRVMVARGSTNATEIILVSHLIMIQNRTLQLQRSPINGKATKLPHLVYRVDEKGALEASDEAQTAELEMKPSATKKPRISNGSTENDSKPSAAAIKLINASNNNEFDDDEEWTADDIAEIDEAIARKQSADLVSDMLEEVMGILLNERLHQLQNDFISLYSMRCVCKTFKRAATLIAKEKLKTLNLSVTPLVNGFEQYGESMLDGYDSETCDAVLQMWGETTDMIHYKKKEKIELAFREDEEAGAGHYPIDDTLSTYDWDSGWLNNNITRKKMQKKDTIMQMMQTMPTEVKQCVSIGTLVKLIQ